MHQLPGPLKSTQITLKRGLADSVLWDWFREGAYDGKVVRRNVSIVLYGGDREETRRWSLNDVYPTKWTGVDFKADQGQVVVETLEMGQGGGDLGAALVQRRTVDGSIVASRLEQRQVTQQAIDLPALAQHVYDLLKQELRRERERLGRT